MKRCSASHNVVLSLVSNALSRLQANIGKKKLHLVLFVVPEDVFLSICFFSPTAV